MASPFDMTRRRPIGVFLGLWVVTFVSIILRATTPPASDRLGAAVRTVGVIYYDSLQILLELVARTELSDWLLFLSFGLLALGAVALALFLLDSFAFRTEGVFLVSYFYLLVYAAVFVPGLTVVLWLLSFGTTLELLDPAVSLVFELSPRVLVLAVVGIAISFVTSYVP